jgi:hypothetical protein
MGGDDRLLRGVLACRQPDAERERRRGVVAGIDRAELLKAADHEAGRDQEHQGECDLSAHHDVPRAMTDAARRVAAAALV